MKKIVTILGARPQFVKAAVLSRIIAKYHEVEEVIIHTGQHYDSNMSEVFFTEMNIPKPSYNLGVHGLSHGEMTGQMLMKIEAVLLKETPDLVIVYGDTNSTLAGALAAKKLNIKVVHVEAGLRSFNMKMPEEINRILTDRISDLLLCPTSTAVTNLKKEGFENFNVAVVNCGDIMKDAVEFYAKFSEEKSTIISDLSIKPSEFVVATIHRQENTDDLDKLKAIFGGLETIHEEMKVIVPLHPRTKEILKKNNLSYNLEFINPVGYFDMLALLKNCNLVITDSGGLQKEAFFNKKYSIIVRDETEWIELVNYKFAKICGANKALILEAFNYFQTAKLDFSVDLFGNNVGDKIYKEILKLM